MKFNVTEVEFDFDEFGDGNPEWQLTFDEEIEIIDFSTTSTHSLIIPT